VVRGVWLVTGGVVGVLGGVGVIPWASFKF
jgi:hypothetical protein